ncbi:hypothetical protein ANTQUA_LOCUS9423 [Anthophora quadrimaculata]
MLHLRGVKYRSYFTLPSLRSIVAFQRARKSTYATSLLRSCTVSYLIHFFSIIREQNKRKMEQEEGREKKRRKMKRQKPNREYVTKYSSVRCGYSSAD